MKRIVLGIVAVLAAALASPAEAAGKRTPVKNPPELFFKQEVCAGVPSLYNDENLVKALRACPQEDDACLMNAVARHDRLRDYQIKRDAKESAMRDLAPPFIAGIAKLLEEYAAQKEKENASPEDVQQINKAVVNLTAISGELKTVLAPKSEAHPDTK